jgi:hypothetical protein
MIVFDRNEWLLPLVRLPDPAECQSLEGFALNLQQPM